MDRILESKVLFVVYPKFVMLFSFPSMIFFFLILEKAKIVSEAKQDVLV